jgi:hypothetical protein
MQIMGNSAAGLKALLLLYYVVSEVYFARGERETDTFSPPIM